MAKQYDAIVIGGGILGCSVAWRLAQTGRRVALLERGQVGGEASSAAGGFLCPKAGSAVPAHLLQFWQISHRMYPAFVDKLQAASGDAFECRAAGELRVSFSEAEADQLAAT